MHALSFRTFFPILIAALLAPFLHGCSIITPSTTVQYFVLASPAQPTETDSRPQGPRVGLLPPEMPGYLQRPQMILRDGDSVNMRMESYHRWGEDLALGISRVLTSTMNADLTPVNALVLPLRMGVPVDWRIQIAIRRFEGAPNSTATLEAAWVFQKDGTVVHDGSFSHTIPSGPTIDSLVQAQSNLLITFAHELSTTLLPLIEGASAR